MNKLTFTILITLAAIFSALAQEPDRGFRTANSYAATGLEVVNTTNGNLLLNIPLASLPAGRGTSPGYTVFLRYDSKLFDSIHTTRDDGYPDENGSSYFSTDTLSLSERGGWKMPIGYQLQITDRRNLQTADVCHMHDPVEQLSFVWKVEMVMPDGSIRTFLPVAANGTFIGTGADGYSNVNYNGEELTAIQGTHPGSGTCYTDVSSTGPNTSGMNYVTMDGSRLRLFIPYSATVQPNLRNWRMYYPDGTVVERAPANSSAWQTITDRNGNKIEFIDNKIQDSAGRYIEFASDSTGQIVRTKGVGAAVVETHIEWENRWIQKKYRTTTANNAQSSQQYATLAASVYGVKKITFPTQAGGQTMAFEYFSNATQPGANVYTDEWGEIKSIELPTGAESSFVFDQVGQGGYETLASDVLARSVSNKELAYDEVYEGTTSQRVDPWLYSISKWVSTITIPSGAVSSEYLFYNSNGSYWDSGMSYRSTGPNGGITERLWAYNLPFAMSGSIPPASGGWSGVGSANSYVKAEFSTLPDASGNISSSSPTAIKEFKFDKNGNVLEVLEYDWVTYGSVPRSGSGINAKVTGLPTSGLTLKRKTVNTYYNQAADADSTSVNGNEYMSPSSPSLKNLIRSTEVRDGSGVVKARSEFYYDSTTTTGNLTETRVWDSTKGAVSDPLITGTSGNAVSTQATYDAFGNPTTATDAKGIVSKITYGAVSGPNGNVTGLYPTETILAYGTSLARTSTASYDFYTGAVLATTDEDNDITNATEYDDIGRPIKAITAQGTALESWTITEYHDDDRFVVVKSDLEAKGDGKKVATQFYDQLGRVRLTKTLEDASTQSATNETDGIKVQTRYGINDPTPSVTTDPENSLGSYSLVSNPYRAGSLAAASAETTMGWTLSYSSKTGRHSDATTYSGSTVPTVGSTTNSTGVVQTDIDANATTVTDQANKVRRSLTNALGQLIRVDEPNSSNQLGTVSSPNQATNYTYNTLGKMVRVEQGSQNRYFMYDSLGRTLRIRQPEQEVNTGLNTSGDPYNNSWTGGFTYDNNGNVLTTTDAKGTTITNTYDALNRPLTRTYNDSPQTATVTNTYGTTAPAIGKLIKVSSSVSETQYSGFDVLGRLTESKQITPLDGETISTAPVRTSSYQYNLSGALIQQTYPSGRVVETDLDASGDIEKITGRATSSGINHNFATAFSYLPDGKIASLKLGNGLWEAAKVNSRLQVTEIAMGHSIGDGAMMKLNYEYGELQTNGTVDATQNAGNIAKQTVTFSGLANPFVQTYKYDSLDRIKEAKEAVNGNQTWIQTFGYDRFGNRNSLAETVNGQAKSINELTLPTVDANTNRFSSTTNYEYDEVGNLIRDANGRQFIFNGDNKQTQVKDVSDNVVGTYVYDGNGKRVKKITASEVTVFVYDGMGKLVAEYSTATPPTNPTVNYTATDTLGSPRVLTDQLGQVRSRRDFMPFGEEVALDSNYRTTANKYGTGDKVRQKFTGYQRDEETDLDFAEARYYYNDHGRFTAVDPLLASGKNVNPQTFNRYVYVLNCPLMFTDPSGLQAGRQQYGTQPPPTKIIDIFVTITVKERQNTGSQRDWNALAKSAPGYQTVNVYTVDDGSATVDRFKSSLESEGRTVVVFGHSVAESKAVKQSTATGSRLGGMGLSFSNGTFQGNVALPDNSLGQPVDTVKADNVLLFTCDSGTVPTEIWSRMDVGGEVIQNGGGPNGASSVKYQEEAAYAATSKLINGGSMKEAQTAAQNAINKSTIPTQDKGDVILRFQRRDQ